MEKVTIPIPAFQRLLIIGALGEAEEMAKNKLGDMPDQVKAMLAMSGIDVEKIVKVTLNVMEAIGDGKRVEIHVDGACAIEIPECDVNV